jgi:hypothetical protein
VGHRIRSAIVVDRRSGAPLLVRGNLVKMDLEDGRQLDVPNDWGMLHDPSGNLFPSCEFRIQKYTITSQHEPPIDTTLQQIASAYFGENTNIAGGKVEILGGPWQRVGRVGRIYYARPGSLRGLYQHPFEEGAEIYERKGGRALRLSLPSGCIVDAHGFVWP